MFVPRVDTRPYLTATLVALIALAWLALWAWGQSPYGRFLDHDEIEGVHFSDASEAALLLAVFATGWTVMTVAMMLPTSLPLITMFQQVVSRRTERTLLLLLLIAGYMLVWGAFGAAAHTADRGLHALVGQWHWLEDNSYLIAAGTLLFAGVYQFTPLKYACLDKCRSPYAFITEHWRGGNAKMQALRLGIYHGLFCVGCCWSLMLLMFVVGVGSLGWMLILGSVMAVEKNMPWGRRLSAPLGVVLIVSAAAFFLLGAPEACAHEVGGC